MSERRVWAYRLVVTIPPERQAPGFVPEELLAKETYRDFDEQPFSWPPRRLYFDWSSAQSRASLLSRWGAHVTIERALVTDWTPCAVWEPFSIGVPA